MKKTTMDVARIMIRTSCQLVVDEFIDVKINGKIFHLRILEDSYGPMRILIPQNKNANGRDVVEERSVEGEIVRVPLDPNGVATGHDPQDVGAGAIGPRRNRGAA
jgi:hypothetical protein